MKRRTKKAEMTTINAEDVVDPEQLPPVQICNAWCFILGPLGVHCNLAMGHEGDHHAAVKSFVEPVCHFTIYWGLDNNVEPVNVPEGNDVA